MWTQETDITTCRPRAWIYEGQRFREREISAQEVKDGNGPMKMMEQHRRI